MKRRKALLGAGIAGAVITGSAGLVFGQPKRTSFRSHGEGTLPTDRRRRSRWRPGQFDGTRLRRDGRLVLDDVPTHRDDFDWSDPAASPFDWIVREPGESTVTPEPEHGRLRFSVANRGEMAEIEQHAPVVDFDAHPDWRLTVVEQANVPTVHNAWEFWFSRQPLGQFPWVLIDAGGGGDVPTSEDAPNSCGFGFRQRRDQLLSRGLDARPNLGKLSALHTRYFGRYLARGFRSPVHCWDEFADAPIDHSTLTRMTLEVYGADGVVNGYVNGRLQADLRRDQGQFVPNEDSLAVGARFHDRGDHDEVGYLHRVCLQRIGVKRTVGTYRTTVTAEQPGDWTVTVDAQTPDGTAVRSAFATPDQDEWVESSDAVPETDELLIKLELRTTDRSQTPTVNGISTVVE